MPTKIAWTRETWNPVTGCTKVSEACRYCYAEALHNKRYKAYQAGKNMPKQYAKPFNEIQLLENRLVTPFGWRKQRMVFVGSMMDLFHPEVPDFYIAKVFGVMSECPRHIFQVLTKRPLRTTKWPGPWTSDIWMGTTGEHQKTISRIDILRECSAQVRFLSFEPLIGPVGDVNLDGIHWAIVGGESGPNRRALDFAWVREIRDQCVERGVAFFFKQDSGPGPGMRPWLVEEDGLCWEWKQYPTDLISPRRVG